MSHVWVVAYPSSPSSLAPQHSTTPFESSAQAWTCPPVIATALMHLELVHEMPQVTPHPPQLPFCVSSTHVLPHRV